MPKPTHHQNICRFEHKRYQAWVLQIRRRGHVIVRYFGDGKHGGRQQALAEAIRQRDHLLASLPPLVFVMRRYPLNKTGVVGVRVQVLPTPYGTYFKKGTVPEIPSMYRV